MIDKRPIRLLVLCPYPEGVAAGQRLKYEQYFDDWRAHDIDVDVSPYMSLELWQIGFKRGAWLRKIFGVIRGYHVRLRDLLRIRGYDAVYVFMWVTPFGTSLAERLVRRLASRLIVDVEDNVVFPETQETSDHPNSIVRSLRSREKIRHLIRTADHVITSSPYLNTVCLALNTRKHCTYISSSVDVDRFVPANSYENEKPVVIGWTGTFSSKEYLDSLKNVFKELRQRVQFKLKVVGNFDYELEGVDLEVVHWTKEREVEDLQTFDIGVYPLPTNEWVLGKSGLKAIQYMAFGLPIVATNVGTTPLILKNQVNGILVETEVEWIEALERLIREPLLRKRLGEKARLDAVAKYSTKIVAQQYRDILRDVIGSTS